MIKHNKFNSVIVIGVISLLIHSVNYECFAETYKYFVWEPEEPTKCKVYS